MSRRYRFRPLFWALAPLLLASTALAHGPASTLEGATAGSQPFDQQRALAVSQQAIGRELSDHRFVTSGGEPFRLATTRGAPLIVNLVYTSCDDICPLTVQRLARAVEAAQSTLGVYRFNVLTIGFDTRVDTPQRMRDFEHAQGIDFRNWRFLSTDAVTVEALTTELGFSYVPRAGGFNHLSQTTLVDADGRIAAQIYGDEFPPQSLIEPLKDLLLDRVARPASLSGLLERIKLICTVYDPSTGRYRFSYAILTEVAIGGLSLLAFGLFLVRVWLQSARAKPRGRREEGRQAP